MKTETPTFIYRVLPTDKKEKLVIKRKVQVIKKFLIKIEELQVAKEKELSHLKHYCQNNSVDEETYLRFKQLIDYKHEQKRLDLIKAAIEKNVEIEKSAIV